MPNKPKFGLFYNPNHQPSKDLLSSLDLNMFIDLTKKPDATVKTIVVLGGDGAMLGCVKKYFDADVTFYGIKTGRVGFLMNQIDIKNIVENLEQAISVQVPSLESLIFTTDKNNPPITQFGINDINLFRYTGQASILKIEINDKIEANDLICDGVLVYSPVGSTGYNSALGGKAIPVKENSLGVVAVAPASQSRFKNTVTSGDSKIVITNPYPIERPCNCAIDGLLIKDVSCIEVKLNSKRNVTMLFNEHSSLMEKQNNLKKIK